MTAVDMVYVRTVNVSVPMDISVRTAHYMPALATAPKKVAVTLKLENAPAILVSLEMTVITWLALKIAQKMVFVITKLESVSAQVTGKEQIAQRKPVQKIAHVTEYAKMEFANASITLLEKTALQNAVLPTVLTTVFVSTDVASVNQALLVRFVKSNNVSMAALSMANAMKMENVYANLAGKE